MPLTERQKAARRAKIVRWAERRAKRVEPTLPDAVADETVEVVTPDAEMEALPDPD